MIPVGQRPWGIALTPDGRKLYAANGLSNVMSR
jgi:DNA-binding beta-propeller fold protein YncE